MSAEEMMASVDATLSDWRSAFELDPSFPAGKNGEGERGAKRRGGAGASPRWASDQNHDDDDDDDDDDDPSRPSSSSSSSSSRRDPDGYRRRLGTFGPSTYFAKPLVLSPLVCAAFGWENTGKDIIRCAPCGAAICVAFHPSLGEESRDGLCRKYLGMLVSSHAATCPFRSRASRWSRVMGKCNPPGGGGGKKSGRSGMIVAEGKDPELLLASKVSDALEDSDVNFYVPPYFLAISDEFLRFEDRTADGSFTHDIVEEGAARIRDKLRPMDIGDSQVNVLVPDAVKDFCDVLRPGVDLYDVFHEDDGGMRASYLLFAFGWSVCEESVAGGGAGVIMKCTMCQARSWLQLSCPKGEKAPAKKRRIDVNIRLIDSHRVYCPYVSGFSFHPGRESNVPGWKVVVSNLLKKATPINE